MGILHDIMSCWTTLGPFQRPTGRGAEYVAALQRCWQALFILPGTFIFGLILWSNFMPGTFIFGQMLRFTRIVLHFRWNVVIYALCRILAEMSRFTRFARHKFSADRHLKLFCTPASCLRINIKIYVQPCEQGVKKQCCSAHYVISSLRFYRHVLKYIAL